MTIWMTEEEFVNKSFYCAACGSLTTVEHEDIVGVPCSNCGRNVRYVQQTTWVSREIPNVHPHEGHC